MDTQLVRSFYSYAKLLSYRARYNFAVGGRGIGKTYGAKKKVVRDAIKSHIADPGMCDQFIYLRRYKDELRLARDTFFADFQHEFPNWDFRIQGSEAQMSPVTERETKKRQWFTIGYFIALSVAQSYKSVAFPRVKVIIYDEFILEKSATHYLPNEAHIFNNFFSTVDRNKDKTRVFFLANSVRIENPYFIEYKIDPDEANEDGFIKLYGGFVIVHFIRSEDFENEVLSTKFGQFISQASSEFADFAIRNQFSDNHKSLIANKPPSAKYLFTIEVGTVWYSVWYDAKSNKYYFQMKRPSQDEKLFTLAAENMKEGVTLFTFNDKPLQMLRTAFRHDRARFDKASTRNALMEIFSR